MSKERETGEILNVPLPDAWNDTEAKVDQIQFKIILWPGNSKNLAKVTHYWSLHPLCQNQTPFMIIQFLIIVKQ